jgi:hypothetical protein
MKISTTALVAAVVGAAVASPMKKVPGFICKFLFSPCPFQIVDYA